MNFRQFTLVRFCFVCISVFFYSSCRVTYQSGYDANKHHIAINLKDHNLGYMYPPDTLITVFNNTNIDKFDYAFLHNTYYHIYQAGFSDKDYGSMGTFVLKDCVVDLKILPPVPLNFHEDTLNINYMQANLICKQGNSNDLFYTSALISENYEAIVLDQPYKLPYEFTKGKWVTNKNTAYLHHGFNDELLVALANELAYNAVNKIDTLALKNFHAEHPAEASKIVTTKHVNATVLVIAILVIFFVLIKI